MEISTDGQKSYTNHCPNCPNLQLYPQHILSCPAIQARLFNISPEDPEVSRAHIPEGPNLYIQSGSTINLTCIITESTSPPVFVFWYHDDRMINYDSSRGGIKVTTENGPTTVSRLRIQNARPTDSGNYSCQPSYADPANITVHVLNGEKPAAMQHGRSSIVVPAASPLHIMLAVFVCYAFRTATSFVRR
ncbi:uncharacterized protein TNCV_1360121 [Trichonephila clavipes]|nr:uncharacterized protein TNCV_1360121 [Trichonephila clavipes]